MKFIKDIYKDELNLKNDDEVFQYLLDTAKDTISGWDYYVKWSKAIGNTTKVEVQLNILNVLVGKENVELELRKLLKDYPEIIKVVPIVIASREKKFKVLEPLEEDIFNYKEFDFSRRIKKGEKLSEKEIDLIIEFLNGVGFLDLFRNKNIKNIVDYTLGVEVGLDSNGRKNRTGDSMEDISELLIKDICKRNGWEYITQATVEKIYKKWKITVPTDKSKRIYDFVINNGGKLLLSEVNYYNGGGSKLKTVANEFTKLNKYITDGGFTFCWITDGLGWQTAKQPLRDAFDSIEYIINLNMIENGVLEYIIKNCL